MKVEPLVVRTKAFQVTIRVQNGRIVCAPKVIEWARRSRLTRLVAWLHANHPGYWMGTPEQAKEMRPR